MRVTRLCAAGAAGTLWRSLREQVTVVREMMGKTDGAKSPPGTIRGDFGISVQNNLIHGSDSTENAATEISLWFTPAELVSWQTVDASWIG